MKFKNSLNKNMDTTHISEQLTILYTNADCFFNKLQELKHLISTLSVKPNLIAITEVKYKNNNTFGISELNLEGYTICCNDLDKNSRGVLLYVADSLESQIVNFEFKNNEHVFIQLKCTGGKKLLLGNIYRSPNSDFENDEQLCNMIKNACKFVADELIIVGDFNFRDINWDKWESVNNSKTENMFLSELRDNFLLQHVNMPTRARGTHTPHILDLVITKDESIESIEYLAPLGKSDHAVLIITCDIRGQASDAKDRLNYNKGDYEAMRKSLKTDWDALFEFFKDDVDGMWRLFMAKMEDTAQYIPKVARFSSWKKNLGQTY